MRCVHVEYVVCNKKIKKVVLVSVARHRTCDSNEYSGHLACSHMQQSSLIIMRCHRAHGSEDWQSRSCMWHDKYELVMKIVMLMHAT